MEFQWSVTKLLGFEKSLNSFNHYYWSTVLKQHKNNICVVCKYLLTSKAKSICTVCVIPSRQKSHYMNSWKVMLCSDAPLKVLYASSLQETTPASISRQVTRFERQHSTSCVHHFCMSAKRSSAGSCCTIQVIMSNTTIQSEDCPLFISLLKHFSIRQFYHSIQFLTVVHF